MRAMGKEGYSLNPLFYINHTIIIFLVEYFKERVMRVFQTPLIISINIFLKTKN